MDPFRSGQDFTWEGRTSTGIEELVKDGTVLLELVLRIAKKILGQQGGVGIVRAVGAILAAGGRLQLKGVGLCSEEEEDIHLTERSLGEEVPRRIEETTATRHPLKYTGDCRFWGKERKRSRCLWPSYA